MFFNFLKLNGESLIFSKDNTKSDES